jgi:multiple sugar transport system substrate-binding protein
MTCHIDRLTSKIGILLALILLIILAGCRPTQSDVGAVTHLTLWHGVNPPSNRDIFQKLVTKFNHQNPNIQVEPLYIGQGDQQLPKILTAVVGNAVPDLLWVGAMLTGKLVDLEAIEPLDRLWDSSQVSKEIDPNLRESIEYEQHIWSIPVGTNNVGIFYRPSLFKAAGIKNLPTTWSELRATAKQLTRDLNGDGKVDRYGMLLPLGKGEWTVFMWLPFMWSAGGELQADPGKDIEVNQLKSGTAISDNSASKIQTNIHTPGSIAALELWHNLIQDGSAILSSPERGYELDNFLAGKVAMQLTGPWTLGQLAQTKVDYAVMSIPMASRPATSMGVDNLFMMNKGNSTHQQAVWQFMEYILSQEFQTAWALGTGYLPVNLQSRQQSTYQEYVRKTPATQVFLSQAKYGRSRPIGPEYSQISDNLGRAIESVLLGKSSAQNALQTAQDRLNLTLDR